MSKTVTVKRNWKKKIEALCGVTSYKSYSLHSNFVGVEVKMADTAEMYEFIKKEMVDMYRSKLTYNKDNGACCLHIHSNLWFSWVCKIDW